MDDQKKGSGVNGRLGGPPGLYDSPNRERDATGGIYQRVRVPDAPEERLFPYSSENNILSLNDSDNDDDLMEKALGLSDDDDEAKARERATLEAGVIGRKTIRSSGLY
jgi:hypothetical protein